MKIGEARVGVDRLGAPPPDVCPLDGARGVFRRTALVCPRCGRLLGGF